MYIAASHDLDELGEQSSAWYREWYAEVQAADRAHARGGAAVAHSKEAPALDQLSEYNQAQLHKFTVANRERTGAPAPQWDTVIPDPEPEYYATFDEPELLDSFDEPDWEGFDR